MACPHVAGAAALLLKANPNLSPSQVTNILIGSADDLGSTGKDNLYGYGLVDVDRALSLATTAGPSTLPNTVTASKGSVTGAISETLSADDNKYMTLKSGKAGSSQVSDTSYKLTLPQKQSQIDTLTVTSISMYSSTVTQNLYIYDYTTKAWTLMKNPSIGQTEQTTVFTVSNAARYVSANGEVNARIYTSKSTSFTGSLDVFNFAVTYVP
jgi:hypothetical protein